jgi:hypothetical protein
MRRLGTVLLVAGLLLLIGGSAFADGPNAAAPAASGDPLVRVLAAKGILTADEATALATLPADQQRDQLTAVLLKKGVITQSDLRPAGSSNERLVGYMSTPGSATYRPAILVEPAQAATPAPAAPKPPAVIAAVAPIRVAPIDSPKREGLVPAFKLGPVAVRPYGFVKMSVVHDSSMPLGNDFLLPGFIGDSGPNSSPEFRLKARATRFGSNFEWIDPSNKLTLTGKIEADFEGNYTAVSNRGISSLRSSMPSMRLAYGRFDYATTPTTTIYGVFGQDWTPFGSSTLPNSLETTGLGIGYGSLYERGQMVKGGVVHNFGGPRTFKLLVEAAAVNPSSGNQPFPFPASNNFQIPGNNLSAGIAPLANTFLVCPTATPTGCTSATAVGVVQVPQIANNGLGVGTQLAIGERQGVDSDRPEVEARVAFQWQLDKAPGVAPAQLIVSGVQGRRESVVLAANVPTLSGIATAGGALPAGLTATTFTAAFGSGAPAGFRGVRTGSDRWGLNPQFQLPTRWFTLIGSYYRGADLRWFFAGQILSFYNDTAGMANTVTLPNVDGSSTVVIGTVGGVPTVAPQRPIRTSGGFLELSLPLSRLAHANPTGRNAGWTMNLHYGRDDVNNRDLRKASPTASIRDRSDWGFVNLMYKLNNFVTFGYEQSLYRTKALTGVSTGCNTAFTANGPDSPVTIAACYPNTLFRGMGARSWHDSRSEFSTIFTF